MKYIKPLRLRKETLDTLRAIKSDDPSVKLVQRTATERPEVTDFFIAVRRWVKRTGDLELRRWAK